MNVLNEVIQEDTQVFKYPDEKIASNIYYASFSFALKSVDKIKEIQKREASEKNMWLERETKKIQDVPVLNFDNIVKKLSNGKHSCDAFFYNFNPGNGEQHYLAELKNADKKTVLSLLADMGADGVYTKVNDCVQVIKKELEFGGIHEHDDIIAHTHFFIVYSGKNNVPSKAPITMVRKTRVSRDCRGKQAKAGRIPFDSAKEEGKVFERFGNYIRDLGLQECNEGIFPGNALPRARRTKGRCKTRIFSIFSAHDFAEIINADFFAGWNWGNYQQYF